MSISQHLDNLSIYNSAALRVTPMEGDPEDLLGAGGGLQVSFDKLGRRPLVDVLADPRVASVMLADGDLEIEARRAGGRGLLTVTRGGRLIISQIIDTPTTQIRRNGIPFRPDLGTEVSSLTEALHDPTLHLYAARDAGGKVRWFTGGRHGIGLGEMDLVGEVGVVGASTLGAKSFQEDHGVRYAYLAGAMAGGISSVRMMERMAQAGLMATFGSGGLALEAVEAAIVEANEKIPSGRYCFNLLHNPVDSALEEATVDLYLKHKVKRVSASAFMQLTRSVVRYRLSGIHQDESGSIITPNSVIAKVSRIEVATPFFKPAPDTIVDGLVKDGSLTKEQAELAKLVPVATDVIAEADSGGHTDRRPLSVLLPVMLNLRDQVSLEQGYAATGVSPRVGAAGGLGSPTAVWAAFAAGADFVVTGSVNQATQEAGTSDMVREMLAAATSTDVAIGPAPDMFELGAHVQVLSRGTMYAKRGDKLYELYRKYDSMDQIPSKERSRIEKQMFKRSLDDVWADTAAYWSHRDPEQVERAEQDPHHKMALTFRWYLGMTSRWARMGDASRKLDFQIWCSPAMGGFNEWVHGSSMEPVANRAVDRVAMALLNGAAAMSRVSSARTLIGELPVGATSVRPSIK